MSTQPEAHDLSGVYYLLGQLLERSTATQQDVRETRRDIQTVTARLAHGDAQFAELRRTMNTRKTEIGQWERLILEAVRIGQFLGVLWLTGSIDAAARIFGLK